METARSMRFLFVWFKLIQATLSLLKIKLSVGYVWRRETVNPGYSVSVIRFEIDIGLNGSTITRWQAIPASPPYFGEWFSSSIPSKKDGGEGRIRTSEGIANRFTVCPLWPLGNLSDSKSSFLGWTCPPGIKKTGKSKSYNSGIRIIKNRTYYV